ncbi:MAG TPA: hypothetical protein VM261_09145 [Kofleriaceae bacterium]|nr:hypothetical protein [Kofleriaceae bacterium]
MSRRNVIERVEGFVFDVLLAAVAVMVTTDEIQAWLFEHPRELYYGVAFLHVVAMPVVMAAAVAGYGQSEKLMQHQTSGPNLLVWSMVLFYACGFIVPGVLGLALDTKLWVMMSAVFGPIVMLVVVGVGAVMFEKWGWTQPAKVGVPKAWWKVQMLSLVGWAYLLWMETTMLVVAEKGGVLAETGLPMGVLVDYVPVRVVLYYVRDASRWEILTIVASTLHLIVRLAAA